MTDPAATPMPDHPARLRSGACARIFSGSRWLLAIGLLGLAAQPAIASRQLAADHGCYSCHGEPPRKRAPTFAELAQRYAGARDDPEAQQALADKLRDGSILSHIDAHERLSAPTASLLIRWISEGAR